MVGGIEVIEWCSVFGEIGSYAYSRFKGN